MSCACGKAGLHLNLPLAMLVVFRLDQSTFFIVAQVASQQSDTTQLRDITVHLLTEVCNNMMIEPPLQVKLAGDLCLMLQQTGRIRRRLIVPLEVSGIGIKKPFLTLEYLIHLLNLTLIISCFLVTKVTRLKGGEPTIKGFMRQSMVHKSFPL